MPASAQSRRRGSTTCRPRRAWSRTARWSGSPRRVAKPMTPTVRVRIIQICLPTRCGRWWASCTTSRRRLNCRWPWRRCWTAPRCRARGWRCCCGVSTSSSSSRAGAGCWRTCRKRPTRCPPSCRIWRCTGPGTSSTGMRASVSGCPRTTSIWWCWMRPVRCGKASNGPSSSATVCWCWASRLLTNRPGRRYTGPASSRARLPRSVPMA